MCTAVAASDTIERYQVEVRLKHVSLMRARSEAAKAAKATPGLVAA